MTWPDCDIEGRNGPRTCRINMPYLRKRWEEHTGQKIPEGHVLMHLCDEERCGNYDHLRPGTFKENSQDAMRKGRMKQTFQSGEDHRMAKLTDARVIEILQRVIAGESQRSLAREFGVDPSLISRMVAGKRWGHLKAVV